jgi:PiT family inorganic phosphate transporter
LGALITLLNYIGGLSVGFSTGANDAANAMGTAVGAGVRTVRQAVVLVAVFGLLGALLQGSKVIATVGNGIIPLADIDATEAGLVVLCAYLSAGAWVTLTTFLCLPTSTSHSLISAVAGAGMALGGVPVLWSKFGMVALAWILTPIGSGLVAFILGKALRSMQRYERKLKSLWGWLLTLSGIYMAYSWGANDVANATGPMTGTGALTTTQAVVLGGISISLGVLLWGHKVMKTIGSDITKLVPSMAFAAELASALNVHLYASLGLPVSTSHAIVGGVVGVGISGGLSLFYGKTLYKIVLAWAATPLVCLALGFTFAKFLS